MAISPDPKAIQKIYHSVYFLKSSDSELSETVPLLSAEATTSFFAVSFGVVLLSMATDAVSTGSVVSATSLAPSMLKEKSCFSA